MSKNHRHALIAVALIAALWLGLQAGLRLALEASLRAAGADTVSVGSLRLNPLTGDLTVRALRLYRGGAEPASLAAADINLSMLALLIGRLHVESARIHGAYVLVQRRSDGRIEFAGLPLSGAAGPNPGPPSLSIDQLEATDLAIDLFARSRHTQLQVDRLKLSELTGRRSTQAAPLDLKARLNGAPLALQARLRLSPHPTVEGSLNLSGLDLPRLLRPWLAPLPLLAGSLDANGLWHAALDDSGAALDFRGQLQAPGLLADANATTRIRGSARWSGRLGLDRHGNTTTLMANGSLTLAPVATEHVDTWLALQQVAWQGGMAFSTTPGFGSRLTATGDLQGEGLDLNRLHLPPYLLLGPAHLAQLRLDGVKLDWPQSAAVETITLNGLDATLSRTPAADHPQRAATPVTLPALNIGALVGKAPLHLRLLDPSVKPPLDKELSIGKLAIGTFDTAEPKRSTPVELAARMDQFSVLRLSGNISPLASPPRFDLSGQLGDFELPPFSPYLVTATGYRVDSGQLDLALSLRSTQGKLDGKAEVTSRKPELTAVDDARAEQTRKKLAMPLPAALALLTDDNGNVHLSIPLSGDLNNPQFNIRDAIEQATTNSLRAATVGYLKLYFQPYGSLIAMLQLAGEAITRVRLDPVEFSVGDATLGDRTQAYLDKVGQLMEEKDQLVLRICPVSTPAIEPHGGSRLGQQRVSAVKEYLHGIHKIPASRLLSCQGFDDNSAKAHPRVELNLD